MIKIYFPFLNQWIIKGHVMFVLLVGVTGTATSSLFTHGKCKQPNSTHDRQGRNSVHRQRKKCKLQDSIVTILQAFAPQKL